MNDFVIDLARRANVRLTRDLMQARAELVQTETETARLGTALADTCAARDALARECNHLEEDREYNAALVTGKDRELAQLQRRLAIPDQTCGYCGYRYSAGTNEANFAVLAEHIKSCPKHPLAKALAELAIIDEALREYNRPDTEDHGVHLMSAALDDSEADFAMTAQSLAQARDELKDLQGANRALGQQVAYVTKNRDYWYETALAAEIERDQIRKEAEGLRRQLKHAEGERDYWVKAHDELEIKLDNAATGEAAIVEAAEAYLAQLKRRHLVMDEDCKNLQDVLEHRSEAAAKLLERLAEAEQQWTWWVGEMQDSEERHTQTRVKLAQVEKQLQEAELAAHVHDRSCVELAQTVHTERARRRVAEREREAMSEMARDRGSRLRIAEQRAEGALATARKRATRMGEAERRANKAVNQLSRAGERERQANQRAERAEALAALVTPGLVELLERLAEEVNALYGRTVGIEFHRSVWATQLHADDKTARALAAQIREALDDSQA